MIYSRSHYTDQSFQVFNYLFSLVRICSVKESVTTAGQLSISDHIYAQTMLFLLQLFCGEGQGRGQTCF